MSIETELTRLQGAKSDIATAIAAKGVTVPSSTLLDGYASLIAQIPSGGGGGVTVESLSVTQNGTYTAPSGTAYSPVTVNVTYTPITEKDVNFYDYDGTLVYSYTATDANALSALPSNPSHTGLTAQGWNWTLAQIKSYLTNVPGGVVNVGQMYVTTSENTEIEVKFTNANYLHPYLGISVNGSVKIHWGDNTETSLTGSSLVTTVWGDHSYSSIGTYIIEIESVSGSYAFHNTGTSYGSIFSSTDRWKSSTSSTAVEWYYWGTIRKIRIGKGIATGSAEANGFHRLSLLESISLSKDISLRTDAFQYCSSLKSIVIPSDCDFTTSGDFRTCPVLELVSFPPSMGHPAALNGAYYLKSVTIPQSLTSIPNSFIRDALGITKITVPSSVTSIGTYAFASCSRLFEFHFLRTTPPTIAATSTFSSLAKNQLIYVPYSADHSILNAYKTATNWSSFADNIVEELP